MHSHYKIVVTNFACVKKDGEMSILHELGRIQEVIDIISEQTKEPTLLPQSGEQVLIDLKSANTTCTYQVCCSDLYLNISCTCVIFGESVAGIFFYRRQFGLLVTLLGASVKLLYIELG